MTTGTRRRFSWEPQYDTGNIMVDRQHRQLIELVNLLLAADQNSDGAIAVNEAFQALRRYVTSHFSDEEQLLDAVDSPHLDSQRKQHRMLIREMETLWSHDSGIEAKQIVHELAQWAEYRLFKHFLTVDCKSFTASPFTE